MAKKKAENPAPEQAPKPKKKGLLKTIRSGRYASLDYFRKNAWLISIVVIVIVALIGMKYKTRTKMVEINRLNKELQVAESDKLREKALYMTLIRETEIDILVSEKGLGLKFREQPPYDLGNLDK